MNILKVTISDPVAALHIVSILNIDEVHYKNIGKLIKLFHHEEMFMIHELTLFSNFC